MERPFDLWVDRSNGVPLGEQLAGKLRSLVASGRLAPGDRLPSLRELAAAAGVNVNTVRAVYGRLEAEGVVASEQGRGTFVTGADGGTAPSRQHLRRQIERLEAELVQLPPLPASPDAPARQPKRAGLLSTEELAVVRDELFLRLRELDSARADVIQRLERLELSGVAAPAPTRVKSRRSTPSLSGARIRWLGA